MDKPAKIVQPNVITSARYEYSVIEKRIIYRIIGMVQQKMGVGMDETLFGEHIIRIPIKDVATNNNYNTVRQSAIALQQKVFSIDKGQGSWLNVGFVSSSEYDSKTGILEFEFSKKIIPYLVELAKGFTSYSLNVALSLRSEYSQRFYEFCSRFKDTGVWNISVKDLKEMLKLEDKYPFYADLKRKVIEVAKKELKTLYDKGECDLYFVCIEKKSGRSVTDLTFKIVSEKNVKAEALKDTDMQYISDMFRNIFTKDYEKEFVKMAINQLYNKAFMSRFAGRLEALDNELNAGTKKREDLPPLIRHILKADYGIS
jgi:plasmid replication initiation protein